MGGNLAGFRHGRRQHRRPKSRGPPGHGAWALASGTNAWSYVLNTSNFLNGSHLLSARATDTSGNVSATNSVSVRFLNVPGDYLQRLSGGNPANVTDCAGNVWLRDQAYSSRVLRLFRRRPPVTLRNTDHRHLRRPRKRSTSASATAPPPAGSATSSIVRWASTKSRCSRPRPTGAPGRPARLQRLHPGPAGADEFRHLRRGGRDEPAA